MSRKFNPLFHYYGKPCKYGHYQSDGRNVRTRTGYCWACSQDKPPGLVDTINGCYESFKELPPRGTPEQIEARRKRHIQNVIKYNQRNPDKKKEWQDRHRLKPEVIEKNRTKAREYYRNLSPDEKKERRNKEYQERYYQENKHKWKERTPEQIEHKKAADKKYYYRKKAEKQQAVEFFNPETE